MAVILSVTKNLLACIVLSTQSLVGFEEMLRVAQHDICNKQNLGPMNNGFWNYLTTKRQIAMSDRDTQSVDWKISISPLTLGAVVVAAFMVIVAVLMVLMAYTSVLDIFPGYRTKSERMTDELTENIMRIDAMERTMSDSLRYNEVVTTILMGSTPTLHSTVMTDTIRYDKSTIMPTRADSLLRRALVP